MRQIDWAFEDVTKLVEELNRVVQTEIPALYSDLMARNLWVNPARQIALPVRKR